jgi:hemerythrin superfamily protein
MNAIDFLKLQHREVETLFKKIEATPKERKALVAEVSQKLLHHSKIEEDILYPAGKKVDPDLTLEAYEEHDCVKSIIKKLSKTKANDETFMAKVTVLKELVEHHVKEEEKIYFPELEQKWSSKQLESMGEQLETEFSKLEKRKNSGPSLKLLRAS